MLEKMAIHDECGIMDGLGSLPYIDQGRSTYYYSCPSNVETWKKVCDLQVVACNDTELVHSDFMRINTLKNSVGIHANCQDI